MRTFNKLLLQKHGAGEDFLARLTKAGTETELAIHVEGEAGELLFLEYDALRKAKKTVAPKAKTGVARIVAGAVGLVKAVKNTCWHGPEWQAMYESRLKICQTCPHAVGAFPAIDTLLGREKPVHFSCELCGCLTNAKTRNPDERCPDNPPRWGRVELPVLEAASGT